MAEEGPMLSAGAVECAAELMHPVVARSTDRARAMAACRCMVL
jgi:hypothetical protein